MGTAVTVVVLLVAATLAVAAVWLLVQMIRTLVELRQIAGGLRTAVGQVLAEPSGRAAVINASIAGEHELGPG